MEKFAKGVPEEGAVDAAIAMLRMGMNEVLPGFFRELEKSTLKVMSSNPASSESILFVKDKNDKATLVAFTKNEHAKEYVNQFPEYRYLLSIKTSELCKGIAEGIGLALNPGHETFGFTFTSEQFSAFKKATAK
ncbi:hypothetical protein VDG1235_7 [Verrucomicrobiia bacterium DG1235]|nr:hypothetical protein VDG1235_7 [Verrucomicrobiae bacterium DG1235]